MSLLEAIQRIPGVGEHEKKKWIAIEIKKRIALGNRFEDIYKDEIFSDPLRPLIKIEAAKMLIQIGQTSDDHFEVIADGLQSEDKEIVSRALQTKAFFNNSNQRITNVSYFDSLFENVSYNTRKKIIKKLARCLSTKHSHLAESFFSAILKEFGVEQALPLLVACSQDFVIETVSFHRIQLSDRVLSVFSQRYPQLIVWYLKLSDPKLFDQTKRFNHRVHLYNHIDALARLITTNLPAFLEIYEMNGEDAPSLQLSKKQAAIFEQNARDHYLNKPKIFFKLLNLEKVTESDVEEMFPKMFPEKSDDFDVDLMLEHLKYYPKEKKASLLLDSYVKTFGKSLLEKESDVSEKLMRILPENDRVKMAKIKEEKGVEWREFPWFCYLTREEVMPKLRNELKKKAFVNDRITILSQMLFCCAVNEDYGNLLDVFRSVTERHRNEIPHFQHSFIRNVQSIVDLSKLSAEHWDLLLEIMKTMHIKAEVSDFRSIPLEFLEKALHFRLIHKLSTEKLFEMMFFVLTKGYYWSTKWNFLIDHPKFEKISLENFLNLAEQKCNALSKSLWNEIKVEAVTQLIKAIYNYNERSLKSKAIELLNPRDFQWVFKELEEIVKENDHYQLYSVKEVLKNHNRAFHDELWPADKDEIKIDITIVNQLKKDSSQILLNWKKYFNACESYFPTPIVQRFVRSLRWYNEIPMKFIDECIKGITEERRGPLLIIFALLVDEKTFIKFVDPLLPTDGQSVDAQERFHIIHHIASAMRVSNEPVPLEMIKRFCDGDYLSTALNTLTSTCKRTSMSKVIPFIKNLSQQRVTVAKHGVRLMALLGRNDQLREFLLSSWREQEHYSVRGIVLAKAQSTAKEQLFPSSPDNWAMMKTMISTISEKDEPLLCGWPFDVNCVLDENLDEYMELLLKMVVKLEQSNQDSKGKGYACSLMKSISVPICNALSEEFLKNLFNRYLFEETTEENQAEAARELLVSVYLQTNEKLEQRLSALSTLLVLGFKRGWKDALNRLERQTRCKDCLNVRIAVRALIARIVFAKMKRELHSKIVKQVEEIFLSNLTHEDDPKSALLLSFSHEWFQADSVNTFANQLVDILPKLIHLFTPFFVYQIANVLKEFLLETDFDGLKNSNVIGEVLEILSDESSIDVSYVTVQLLLLLKENKDVENYAQLLQKIKNVDHSGVQSLVNSIL